MKSTCRKITAVILVLTMLTGILPMGVFATNVVEFSPLDHVAYVWVDGNRDLGVYVNTWEDAWQYACDWGNLLMLKDWKTETLLTVSENKKISIFMNGCTIDRGLTEAKDSGEVFLVRDNAELNLYGGDSEATSHRATTATVTGGFNRDGGGGIHLQKESRVYLYGVSITGNRSSDENGGGGIRLQGDRSLLTMDSYSFVSENAATNGNGGGICLRGEKCLVKGGTVSKNSTAESGGGISVNNKSCSLMEITVRENIAASGKKGGGIYMSEGCGATVSGCLIESNKVENGNGGGIYVDGNNGSLAYTTVQKNTAVLGGGIYIDTGDTLSLSGEINVKDNISSASKKEAANLFLATDDSKAAYLSGYPSAGTVQIGWDKTKRTGDPVALTQAKATYHSKCFVSDVEGFSVYWSWMTEDGLNDRLLRASSKKISNVIPHETTEVSTDERYTVYEKAYKEKYDLKEGIFTYKATEGGDVDGVYYYSDGYFADKPEIYNEHLSTMSLALVMSAFNSAASDFDKEMHNDTYANRFRNAKQLLSDIGFLNENIRVSESFTQKPTDNSIGSIMGVKELSFGKEDEGDPYLLVPIAVRGAGYESEWASNVTLGTKGEAAGFSGAADQVMTEWENFLSSQTDFDLQEALEKGHVKFWVVGFSRAAATANLVAKRLTDKYGKENEIYSYTFETPKGGVDSEALNEKHTYNGKYLNIHNIINSGDIVPMVGPTEMGFKRYGVDHYVPGTKAEATPAESVETTKTKLTVTTYQDNTAYKLIGESPYAEQREDMLKQLAILDDRLIFDDYFSLATMNYIGSTAGDKDMVGPLKNGTATEAADWIPLFVQNLVEWASAGTYSWSTLDGDGPKGDYRKFYSTNTRFSGADYVPVEKALQTFTKLLFGMENTDEFMEAMMYRMNALSEDGWAMTDFYIAVIAMWDEQAQYRQRWYMNDVWEALTKEMTTAGGFKVPAITDFVAPEEKDELKKSTYALLAFLFLFVCRDYDNKLPLEGVDTKQVHLGTLLYNISSILQCHFPGVCMAWLRSYDSHYGPESDFALANTTVTLKTDDKAAPKEIDAEVDVKDGKSTVSLKAVMDKGTGVDSGSSENGAAIYYRLLKNGKAEGTWQLYQDKIVIDLEEKAVYSMELYTARFQKKSEIITLGDEQLRGQQLQVGSLMSEGSPLAIITLFVGTLIGGAVVYFVGKKKKQAAEASAEKE